jgi:HAE1 family hydrophobic/amphiphilic exporter-1
MLPVISFSVQAGNDSARVHDFIKNELTPQLTQIDGVSEVQVVGGKELEIDIKIDVEALTSKGISVTSVYQVLNYGNVTLPLGNATYQDKAIQVRYAGGFNSIEDIENLPVGVADGTNVIRIKDIAKVSLTYPKEDFYISDGETPLMIVNVTKRSDGNTLKIISEVKKVLEKNLSERHIRGGEATKRKYSFKGL